MTVQLKGFLLFNIAWKKYELSKCEVKQRSLLLSSSIVYYNISWNLKRKQNLKNKQSKNIRKNMKRNETKTGGRTNA